MVDQKGLEKKLNIVEKLRTLGRLVENLYLSEEGANKSLTCLTQRREMKVSQFHME